MAAKSGSDGASYPNVCIIMVNKEPYGFPVHIIQLVKAKKKRS